MGGNGQVGIMSDSRNSEYLICFYDFLGQKEWMKSAVKDGKVVPEKQSELDLIAASTMRACQMDYFFHQSALSASFSFCISYCFPQSGHKSFSSKT